MGWGKSLFGAQGARGGPDGHRAYAVGDVHGRLDLLDELLERIASDDRSRGKAKTAIVFLGDLIDRGPESAGVVERLRTYRPDHVKTIFIMGNHEEILLRIVKGETSLIADWLRFGGAECLRSYGVDPEEVRQLPRPAAHRLIVERIPEEHVAFLSSFVDSASFGSYLFVHAGIRPGVPLASQSPQDLRWIRQAFLHDETDHGRIVVHGHTICEEVELLPNRIGIDTGAYRTGVLTALAVEGEERWLIQTGREVSETDQSGSVAKLSVAH
jgi:serine/threonine protein phosphatase 1